VPKCTWEKREAWLREERRISSVTVSGFFLGLIVQFKRIIDQTLSSLLSQACCKAKAPLLVEAERKVGKQSVFSVSQCCKSYGPNRVKSRHSRKPVGNGEGRPDRA